MRILWKYFTILMAFSLVPLLVVAAVSRMGMTNLGETISTEVGRDITRMVTAELTRAAQDSAHQVSMDKTILELALGNLALQAEEAFSGQPGESPPIFFSKDYEEKGEAPEEMQNLKGYRRPAPGNATEPLPVSLDHQVFFLAPGVNRRKVSKDLRRLAEIAPVCRELFEKVRGIAYRMHVSLESGVTAVYPGMSGYPDRFDSRKALFYTETKEAGSGPVWSNLIVSRATGMLFFSVTTAIFDPNGRFLGVAGMDVPLERFLQEDLLTVSWSDSVRSYLVYPDRIPGDGWGLRVVAEKGFQQKAMSMLGAEDFPWFPAPENESYAELVRRLLAGETGAMTMDFNGKTSIWAFAPQAGELSFLLVVPKEAVLTIPMRLQAQVNRLTDRQLAVAGVAVILVMLLVGAVAWVGARAAIRPVVEMVMAWQKLAEGDFSVRMVTRTNDERDQVTEAFNATVPKLEERVRIRQALELAQQVQQSLLPMELPCPSGYDISGASLYCDETGGDYFDAYHIGGADGLVQVIVGDVSGHGVSSALLMASARAMLRALSMEPGPLGDRVTLVNRLLASDVGETGRFMTLFCLELDPGVGAVRWVRAGHDPAAVFDPARDDFRMLEGAGMLLGVLDDMVYEHYEAPFDETGQVLVIGTDGIWETRNPQGEGVRQGNASWRSSGRTPHLSARDIQSAVFQEILDFRGIAPQTDDVTLAVIKKL